MFGRKRKPSDFRDGIQSHLEIESEQGSDPAEAKYQARREFGNVTASEEQFYESSAAPRASIPFKHYGTNNPDWFAMLPNRDRKEASKHEWNHESVSPSPHCSHAPSRSRFGMRLTLRNRLHLPFIRRRSIDRRHGNIVEAQINAKLRAMMDGMVHHETAYTRDARHGE